MFYIAAILNPIVNGFQFAWIGLMDFTGNNSDWRWISDNTSLTFSNWAPSQPDDGDQNCASAVLPSTNFFPPGSWSDTSCSQGSIVGAICEANRVSENS